MTDGDREKLSWAEDLLKDWNSPYAHQAAYEYLAHETLYNPDKDVQDKAHQLLDWAAEHGIA